MLKSGTGAALTTSVAAVVWESEPLVPVIVSVGPPVGVLAAVVTVKVELPAPVILGGLNEAVAFDGNPLTARSTPALKPLIAVVDTV